jgi:uncharacterized protein YukJ
MVKQEFEKLKAAIEAGALTPDQMEDVVYAMHAAYVDHNEAINSHMSVSLEDVADAMLKARSNVDPFAWEMDGADDANDRARDLELEVA